MVAAACMTLVMLGFVLFYLACTKMTAGSMSQLKVQAVARQGLDRILFSVRRASNAPGSTTIYATFGGATNTDAGAYMVVTISTNVLQTGELPFHHYYVGNLQGFPNGLTNGTLYFFMSSSSTPPAPSPPIEIIRGVTNPDRVFDWINGVVNINIRVADENDQDGKQIVYLRSAVAFRNN